MSGSRSFDRERRVVKLRRWLLLVALCIPILALIVTENLELRLLLGPEGTGSVAADQVGIDCAGAVLPNDLVLLEHNTARAPDGSMYVSDWDYGVVLRTTDACGAETKLIRVAGGGPPEKHHVSAVATDVALYGPWGIDVAADGKVYIAEYQFNLNCGLDEFEQVIPCEYSEVGNKPVGGRVLELDGTTLSQIAEVRSAAKVRVGRNGKLYVAAKNGTGSGGVHEVDIASGTATELARGFDSEGIAYYDSVAGGERLSLRGDTGHRLAEWRIWLCGFLRLPHRSQRSGRSRLRVSGRLRNPEAQPVSQPDGPGAREHRGARVGLELRHADRRDGDRLGWRALPCLRSFPAGSHVPEQVYQHHVRLGQQPRACLPMGSRSSRSRCDSRVRKHGLGVVGRAVYGSDCLLLLLLRPR